MRLDRAIAERERLHTVNANLFRLLETAEVGIEDLNRQLASMRQQNAILAADLEKAQEDAQAGWRCAIRALDIARQRERVQVRFCLDIYASLIMKWLIQLRRVASSFDNDATPLRP